jgi:hypothetical protein
MPPHAAIANRRAELLAELFLQDLGATFVARPTSADLGYDFLVGFDNARGGLNMAAVEVKGTEKEVKARFPLPWNQLERLVQSNIPALLLVINVKNSGVYWSWLPESAPSAKGTPTAHIPVRLADSASRRMLSQRLRE